jgi:hypothetical protein
MPKRSFRQKISATLLKGWTARDFRPVILQVLVTALIFFTGVIFKDRIFDFLAPHREVKDWPIYCVLEPEPHEYAPVTADLLVVNISAKDIVASDLESLANEQSAENGTKLSPLLDIEMKDYLVGKAILDIKEDAEFNKEKGRSSIVRLDPTHWQIRLEELKKGKILRFVIHTDEERSVSSRAGFETLPIKLTYARSQWVPLRSR